MGLSSLFLQGRRLFLFGRALFTKWSIFSPPQLFYALVGGTFYAWGFCGFDHPWLAWFALLPLWLLHETTEATAKQAFWGSWLFGLVAHLWVYTWLIYMLQHFAYLPWLLALPIYLLLCAAQSSFFALFGFLLHRCKKLRPRALAFAGPCWLVVLEKFYPSFFPHFLSNSQYRFLEAVQILSYLGPLSISALMAYCSYALFILWQKKPRYQQGHWHLQPLLHWQKAEYGIVLSALAFYLANLCFGHSQLSHWQEEASGGSFAVGLVQCNMGIYDKDNMALEGLRLHQQQSLLLQDQGADLLLWPESGVNFAIPSDTQNVRKSILRHLHTPVIFGGIRFDYDKNDSIVYYNTAFAADSNGQISGMYDKIHLVAFGEFIPFGSLLPFLYDLSPNSGHMDPGSSHQSLFIDPYRYATIICYEDILPDFVRQIMSHGNPHFLVNLTNDAWFGADREPLIHLALSTFRAIEQRRFLLRSTNTGISAIVSPTGQIVAQSAIDEAANLLYKVKPLQSVTFYQQYGDFWMLLWAALWLFYVYFPRLSTKGLVFLKRLGKNK